MDTYAFYKIDTGLIENIINFDDESILEYMPPTGFNVVKIPDGHSGSWSACGIGWAYLNGEFVEPEQPPPQPLVAIPEPPISLSEGEPNVIG